MNTQTLLIALLVVGAAGGAYLFASSRRPPELAADTRANNMGGSVDQGSAERTAWVGLFTSLANTAGSIAGAVQQNNQTRAQAGGSTPK